jgi:hypothetical protein
LLTPKNYESITRPLPRRRFDFKLSAREGDIALFKKTKTGVAATFFEVVIVQRHSGYTIADKFIQPGEHMPSNEKWGTHGWSYSDSESAWKKFGELKAQQPLLFEA